MIPAEAAAASLGAATRCRRRPRRGRGRARPGVGRGNRRASLGSSGGSQRVRLRVGHDRRDARPRQPNAAEAGGGNVEFLRGYIEDIPLQDASVDVVISNCVINLSADKQAVFDEIQRVLRPGGRIGITDIVADDTPHPTIGPSEDHGSAASQGAHLHRIPSAVARSQDSPR